MELRQTNLNYYIHVKLKPEAIDEMENQHNHLFRDMPHILKEHPFKAPKVDKDGYTEFQIWDFMKTFGHTITFGLIPMFETVVKIEVEND